MFSRYLAELIELLPLSVISPEIELLLTQIRLHEQYPAGILQQLPVKANSKSFTE